MRGLGVGLSAAALAGCASVAEPLTAPAVPGSCGVSAAMRVGMPKSWRERPPACALPTAEEVASVCAIHDVVRSPGYVPPRVEEGVWIGGTPMPDYRISALDCRFTKADRNEAACRFMLEAAGRAVATSVTFEHGFWQDHGPAHHVYGTRWSPTQRCLTDAG